MFQKYHLKIIVANKIIKIQKNYQINIVIIYIKDFKLDCLIIIYNEIWEEIIMDVVVSLVSKQKGELSKFLKTFFYDNSLDDDVTEWIYVYNKPKDAIGIIEKFMANKGNFNISLWVQIGEDDLTIVNKGNMKIITSNLCCE